MEQAQGGNAYSLIEPEPEEKPCSRRSLKKIHQLYYKMCNIGTTGIILT
jgi:hypothetical protein